MNPDHLIQNLREAPVDDGRPGLDARILDRIESESSPSIFVNLLPWSAGTFVAMAWTTFSLWSSLDLTLWLQALAFQS